MCVDYTIPKLIRELKRHIGNAPEGYYYTIPKLIRELKNSDGAGIVNGGEVLYNRSGGNYDADRE